MKTLRTFKDFAKEVKSELDAACWDFCIAYTDASTKDCYKSISFLNNQRFSLARVEDCLKKNLADVFFYVKENRKILGDNVSLAAKCISRKLGIERVRSCLSVSLPDSIFFEIE